MRFMLAILFLLSTAPVQAGGRYYPTQRANGYYRTGYNTVTNSPFNPVTTNNTTTLNFTYHIQNPGPVADVGRTLTYASFTEPVAYRIQSQLDAASRTVEQLPATLKETLGITLDTAQQVNVFQESRLKREQQVSQVERLFNLTQQAESLGQSVSVNVQATGAAVQQAAGDSSAMQEIVALTTPHCGKCHGEGGSALGKLDLRRMGQLSKAQWGHIAIAITGGGKDASGRTIPAMPPADAPPMPFVDKMRLVELIQSR